MDKELTITLTGPTGCGKTNMARELGLTLQRRGYENYHSMTEVGVVTRKYKKEGVPIVIIIDKENSSDSQT